MRRFLTILVVLTMATLASAGEVSFSLNMNDLPISPRPTDPRIEARLAQWNDPMGRMMYHFHQQQSWIMRGTMPGSERDSGLALRVKAQNGLPLYLVAASVQSGLDLIHQELVRFGPRKLSEEELEAMDLDERLTELLSRRLVPQ